MPDRLIQTPYQLIGLTKLRLSKLDGLLITDGVGVGKTISAGYIISYYAMKFERPIYVISPMGLVDKWILELKQKFGFDPIPIRKLEQLIVTKSESEYHDFSTGPRIYVVSNTFLRRETDESLDINPGLLVIDEIHNFRNSYTLGFNNLKKICEKSLIRVGLSATPFNNTFADVVSLYHLLFPNYARYTVDATIDEIWSSEKISPVLTKFDKENLGIHFARRDINLHRVSYPSNYIAFIRDKIKTERYRSKNDYIDDSEKFHLDEIMFFRLATSSPYTFYNSTKFKDCREKVKELISDLNDQKLNTLQTIVSQKKDERLIIFCEFVNTLKYIEKNLPPDRKVYSISGEVMLARRIELFEAFEKDETGVLLLTSVGSEGIDLQFCSTVINYDLHWNPMKLEQRIGRIDRVGQKKAVISIHNLMIANSIDEHVLIKLQDKLKMIENTIFSPRDILESIDVDEYLVERLDEEDRSRSVEALRNKQIQSDDPVSAKDELKLYFPEIFEKEEEKARKHISVYDKNKKIKLDDYQVYGEIGEKYCDPELLKTLGEADQELPWIDEDELLPWTNKVRNISSEIKKIMEDYES